MRINKNRIPCCYFSYNLIIILYLSLSFTSPDTSKVLLCLLFILVKLPSEPNLATTMFLISLMFNYFWINSLIIIEKVVADQSMSLSSFLSLWIFFFCYLIHSTKYQVPECLGMKYMLC